MADRILKARGQGIPGDASFRVQNLLSNDIPSWDASTRRWTKQAYGTFTGQILTTSTAPVDLVDSDCGLLVGNASGSHMEMDPAKVQAKSNATTATTLELNPLGGTVRIGGISAANLFLDPTAEVTISRSGGTTQLSTRDNTASDRVSGIDIRHRDGNLYDAGIAAMPELSLSTTLTLDPTHQHKAIRITSGTNAITFANEAAMRVNSFGWIMNVSGSNNTLTQGAGVTLRWMDGAGSLTGNRTLANGGWITWWKLSDTEFYVEGTGLS